MGGEGTRPRLKFFRQKILSGHQLAPKSVDSGPAPLFKSLQKCSQHFFTTQRKNPQRDFFVYGFGHRFLLASKTRDPDSRRRAPSFKSLTAQSKIARSFRFSLLTNFCLVGGEGFEPPTLSV